MLALGSQFPALAFAAGAGLLAWVILRERPRALIVVWLAVICFVPWWTGISASVFFPAASLISLFALLCFLPFTGSRFFLTDWAAAALFVACLLPVLVGGSTRSLLFAVVAIWLPAFAVGRGIVRRVGAEWVYDCVAVVFGVVAVLAIAEFVFSWNPFVGFRVGAGPSYRLWAPLLERGGRTRVEGAFGHPIALGSCLALAIPMTLNSRLRMTHRGVLIGLMAVATVLTFSRTGMLCAALGLGLGIVFLQEGLTARARTALIAGVAVLSFALVPLVTSTFAAAGGEASRSAEYRSQLTSLISGMEPVGLSRLAQFLSDGTLYFGQFRSIDSQLILFGLTYGSVALTIALVILLAAIVLVVLGRATSPTIAVVAQIPSLATVALITQYSVFFWFVVGLAAATQTEHLLGRVDHVSSNRTREGNVKSFTSTEVPVGVRTAQRWRTSLVARSRIG